MAGEWIAVDVSIGQKPEVLEIMEITGEGVENVVYRVFALWSWFSLNSADGSLRATPERLATVCGGDADFWRAVESVGWLSFDLQNRTATITGWDKRFSGAAKARACHAKNQRKYREKQSCDDSVTVHHHAEITQPSRGSDGDESPEERRGEERREEEISSSSARDEFSDDWQMLLDAWNASVGKPYPKTTPPLEIIERLREPGWLAGAMIAIARLPQCRFFETPPTMYQLAKPEFVSRVNGGGYDDLSRTMAARREKPLRSSSAKKWWRADAQMNMSDAEYRDWLKKTSLDPDLPRDKTATHSS